MFVTIVCSWQLHDVLRRTSVASAVPAGDPAGRGFSLKGRKLLQQTVQPNDSERPYPQPRSRQSAESG